MLQHKNDTVWRWLFGLTVAGYCLCYAPYGINETDGGFLSGLAWQVLSGKTLYADVVYVRPPVPVWLRAIEMQLLPDQWLILGERWIFYLKVALYSALGAAVLRPLAGRWPLALFAFLLSVHSYPAAAWHTVDGILFGVVGIWLWKKNTGAWASAGSGLCVAAMVLCKQSFYPMVVIWGAFLYLNPGASRQKRIAGFSFLLALLAFVLYLQTAGVLEPFIRLTSGASSGLQALQHGVLDYFRIQPVLAMTTLFLGALAYRWRKGYPRRLFALWAIWLFALALTYAGALWVNQEFTVPFAQARLLFWLATGYGIWQFAGKKWSLEQALAFGYLLGLSWSASVSWGYNLPILFALPGAYAALELSRVFSAAALPEKWRRWLAPATLLATLALFRWGYEFVYRDGRRSEMTVHLGEIFSPLHGVYSTPETAALYRDLRRLADRYGPTIKTMPAFPQANLLTRTKPPLALDWVVTREMGSGRTLVDQQMREANGYYFLEKSYLSRLNSDPELALAQMFKEQGRVVEETPFFLVIRY